MADEEEEQVPGGMLVTIRQFFSSSNPLKLNKKVAKEAMAIVKELNSITSLMNGLSFRELPLKEHCRVVNVNTGRETHSLVVQEEVIGRDEEKRKILAMLLDSDHAIEDVSVIPIVGIGGLGKTTLAQLVFNDESVQEHFELKSWACISEISSLHELAGKILMSIFRGDYRQLTLDDIQSRLRQEVNGKKYLFVFDDIWDEDRNRWLDLRNFLCGGKQGSKIILTTRSKVVAQNMGTVETFELKGLSEGKSWDLFRRLAFKEGQEEGNPYLASIGKEIVKKCANVPLAIKSIASLLYTMDSETEWESFKDKNLAKIEQDHKDRTLLTLKLSYDRLPSELKQCFTYCSLFPKDYVLLKRDLIYLWMAQGFLGSSSGHQSLENVGHGYFMHLMRRCFFQDIEFDEDGEIFSCKMHDLMYDLAQLAAGGDILLVDGPMQQFNDNIWHVSIWSSLVETPWLLATKQTRSLFHMHYNLERLYCGPFPSMRCLRTLYFGALGGTLPNSSELKHLRYLRLGSELCLSEDITRLPKLQTLDLSESMYLEELPRGFSKLMNLRHLHFHDEVYLNDMPPGFGQLTSLRVLDRFIVGENNGLDALSTLNHLAGRLKIVFKKHHGYSLSETTEGILKDTKLTDLELIWDRLAAGDYEEEDELALRCLQPPQTLKWLRIIQFKGVRTPSWGMDKFPCLLPNLVKVEITDCRRCQNLLPFCRLPHLRSLRLEDLNDLEYIENGGNNTEASSAAATEYFPSLESLELRDLPELKGWSRAEEEGTITTITHPQKRHKVENYPCLLSCPFFPLLSELNIRDCPKLKSMPLAPRLCSLKATKVHGKLMKDLLLAEQGLESGSGLMLCFDGFDDDHN